MENRHRGTSLHHWTQAGIAGGFCFLIVRLVQADTLHYYIAPRMEGYVKLAALGLFVLAAFQLYAAIRTTGKSADCTCGDEGERRSASRWLGYGLLLCPLALGFGLPDAIMASDIAAVKGMQLSASSAPAPVGSTQPQGGEPAALFPYDTYTQELAELGMKLYGQESITVKDEGFMEILTTLDIYRDNFIGKTVRIRGFVYREEGMPEDRFIVARLAMQCCSADTLPYGIMAEAAEARAYDKDTWIELVGTIGITRYNDKEILKIDALELTIVEAPETPYVYPYFDDYSNLADL